MSSKPRFGGRHDSPDLASGRVVVSEAGMLVSMELDQALEAPVDRARTEPALNQYRVAGPVLRLLT